MMPRMTREAANQFTYGECQSDHKYRSECMEFVMDFFECIHNPYALSPPEHSSFFVRETLEKLGLPLPKEDDIHHGSNGKLLFLNSHNIVIRVSKNRHGDPRNFLHPHILQPLGWVTSEEHDITIALYPAAHLLKGFVETYLAERRIYKALDKSSFNNFDLSSPNNIAYLKLASAGHYPVCIDISDLIAENPLNIHERKTRNAFNGNRRGQKTFDTLKVIFRHTKNSCFSRAAQEEAFQFHQPLRHAFFMAWKNAAQNEGEPNSVRMQKFWQMAHNYAHDGYRIYGNPENYTNPHTPTLTALWRKFSAPFKTKGVPQKTLIETRKNPLSWAKFSKKRPSDPPESDSSTTIPTQPNKYRLSVF